MVMEMLTTRRGSGFRRATGSGEKEEVGARQAEGSGEGWLRLRWLQREEDEEGTTEGDCGSNDRGTDALRQQEAEAALLCVDGEEGVGGSSKAEEAAGKQRQRGRMAGSGPRRVAAAAGEEQGRRGKARKRW
ncbi:hypothetical protein GW17_00035103 [Ensete ventricosum]|nr:hypothetical protein GW17_00035103 [Ensete ventricosum]